MRVTGIEDEDGSKSAGDDIDCVTEYTRILPGYMNCSKRYQRRFPCLAPFWPLDGRNVCKETRNDSGDTIFEIGYLR